MPDETAATLLLLFLSAISLESAYPFHKISRSEWKLPLRGQITCRHCRQPKLPILLEHIIHINIMRHLEQYKVLNDEQHGFRRGRSREAQLALSVNDLAKVLDKQSQADVVIMDFSKAFDLVPHQRLLLKLCHYVITGKLHNWMQFFLTIIIIIIIIIMVIFKCYFSGELIALS